MYDGESRRTPDSGQRGHFSRGMMPNIMGVRKWTRRGSESIERLVGEYRVPPGMSDGPDGTSGGRLVLYASGLYILKNTPKTGKR